jgi:hypothetical protein
MSASSSCSRGEPRWSLSTADRRRSQCLAWVDDVPGVDLSMSHPIEVGHQRVVYVRSRFSIRHRTDRSGAAQTTAACLATGPKQLRGEGFPQNHLARSAARLGCRTDDAAITAILHPKRSPYATHGPTCPPFGNIADSWKLRSYDHLSVQSTPDRSLEGWLDGRVKIHIQNQEAGKGFGYE